MPGKTAPHQVDFALNMFFALFIESETFGWNAEDRHTGSKTRLLVVAPEVQGMDLFKIANRSISGWIPSLKTGTTVRQPFCSQLEERLPDRGLNIIPWL